MSIAFRALKRSRNDRPDAVPDDGAQAPSPKPRGSLDLPTGDDRLAQLTSVKRQNAHATLLDAMRAVTGKSQTPSIVVAGIAREASALAIIDGVAAQATLRGVRLQIGDVDVTQTHRTLSLRGEHAADPGSTSETRGRDTSLPFELTAATAEEGLGTWFVTAGVGADLLLVAAPPILSSVDALLVARACDGLVLVAEPLATQREEFEIAVERAKASGCRVLGLVMNENRDWLPRFLSRLFSSYPRSISSSAGAPK